MIPMDAKKQGAAVSVPVPPVLSPDEAYFLWMDVHEPMTSDEKRQFISAIRLGVIRSERSRLRAIAEKLRDNGKHGEACAFLLRLTGLPVVDDLCSARHG